MFRAKRNFKKIQLLDSSNSIESPHNNIFAKMKASGRSWSVDLHILTVFEIQYYREAVGKRSQTLSKKTTCGLNQRWMEVLLLLVFKKQVMKDAGKNISNLHSKGQETP